MTLEYLKKIKYGDISKEKKQIENEINNVSFTNSVKETIDNILDNKTYNTINDYLPVITLNKAYRLYKTTIKFNQKINSFKRELEKAESDKDKEAIIEKFLLDDLKFVFDSTKLGIPVYYQVYYAMQVAVWEVVIIGGKAFGYNLASELLQKSLISNIKAKEYDDKLLGSILNNCGAASQQYGVIRVFNVYAEFEYEDFYNEVMLNE